MKDLIVHLSFLTFANIVGSDIEKVPALWGHLFQSVYVVINKTEGGSGSYSVLLIMFPVSEFFPYLFLDFLLFCHFIG